MRSARWLVLAAMLAPACAPMIDEPDVLDAGSSSDSANARDAFTAETSADSALRQDSAPSQDAAMADVASAPDASTRDAAVDATPAPSGPSSYPTDRTQSPITESVQRSMRAILARGTTQDNTFAKVGDSQTVYESAFMVCFAGTSVNLAGHTALQRTIDHFRAGRIAGVTPYERRSLAAVVGWSSGAPLSGSPAPLDQELAAANPRFTVVMYGSNDSQLRNLPIYGENLWEIAARAIARGSIPIFTSPPPRGDNMTADQWIPWYAHVARAVAQAEQVPFIDLERELRTLPNFGLTTADNLHLNRSSRGACSFTTADLDYGQNRRNLLTIQSLDRARAALAAGASAPDAPTPTNRGAGTVASPIEMSALPFVDRRDTSRAGSMTFDRYNCSTANEGGREFVYRLVLTAPTRVHALVLDRGNVDVDLHRLTAANAMSCAARDDRQLVADLPAGTHYFVVDSYVDAGNVAREGDYIFVAFRAQ
jgi:hypothetical protein